MANFTHRLPSIADARRGLHLLGRVPVSLRRPIGSEEAAATVARRLSRRVDDFLALVRDAIYSPAGRGSPYRRLLDLAGCEYGDLERLVRREGVEGALHVLYRRGVYLTVDEFKGRRSVVRGSVTFAIRPAQLHNPLLQAYAHAATSGSRGAPTPVPLSLAHLRDRSVNHRVDFDSRGAIHWRMALCSIPGGASLNRFLLFSIAGAVPVRWFTTVTLSDPSLHSRFRWTYHLMRVAARLGGTSLPAPEYVSLDDPLPIVRWMASLTRSHRIPHLFTYPSVAVRVSQAAHDSGVDLSGGWFTVGGEPITAARLATITRAGAGVVPTYATMETGIIATGCSAPREPDDLHLMSDLHAVIQPGGADRTAGLPAQALLLTSLRPTASLLLFNVSPGDRATLESRACGCPLERIGWTTHVHTVRSFEKLTAGGMTFLDTDVIQVLDDVLPARFGGGPTDYQLLEEEDEAGHPCLRLLVHPRLGPIEDAAVADAFLNGIGGSSGADQIMALVWREGRLVQVERRPPLATGDGKILHLYRSRPASVSVVAER